MAETGSGGAAASQHGGAGGSKRIIGIVAVLAFCALALKFLPAMQTFSVFYGMGFNLLSGIKSDFGDFALAYDVEWKSGDKSGTANAFIRKEGAGNLSIALSSPQASFRLDETPEQTILSFPDKKISFRSKGECPEAERLAFGRLLRDMLKPVSEYQKHLAGDPTGAAMKIAAAGTKFFHLKGRQREGDKIVYSFALKGEDNGAADLVVDSATKAIERLTYVSKDGKLEISVKRSAVAPPAAPDAPGCDWKTLDVSRLELERTLSIGPPRAFQVYAYEIQMKRPPKWNQKPASFEGGQLVWQDGNRVLLLGGTHRQMGRQHGGLVPEEVRFLTDVVLYGVGAFYSYETGTWFFDRMREARSRTLPFVPKRFEDELEGLAEGSGVPLEEIQLAALFPEQFHCSGFAVWGKATPDGKLYHGRVLDYMTEVGLQFRSAVMVCKPEGYHGFVNVGYCGFTGSVTGMNEKQIGIGEMGGRGEGKWDGLPMGYLVRMALEEADDLDETLKIFKDTPRTCQYFYVVSDGKIPSARGLHAEPEFLKVIGPNEFHELLPHPVEDACLLSAGGRYEELVKRVKENYGKLDAEKCRWMMTRPVAMTSNLHDALFAPQSLDFWVANAGAGTLACDEPYAKYNLRELLDRIGGSKPAP
ncbi:MAG TPA: C45 family autoproteolytic acyltransferase/hydrolase [Candidatus Brocadiia bacterium]|nr:C45 family autoproteolytic acyltransferase/hydrolase [Candidatus Brocadiia bacterium]